MIPDVPRYLLFEGDFSEVRGNLNFLGFTLMGLGMTFAHSNKDEIFSHLEGVSNGEKK